jgi:hypothetical protein
MNYTHSAVKMEVNLSNAITVFYPNPSLEMIFHEAVANSIDAGASEINILIKIKNFQSPETLKISITDNGTGFVDKNFDKFKKLLEIDNKEHKGAGRLVFLHYFENVKIVSHFDEHERIFTFSKSFNGEFEEKTQDAAVPNKTSLHFNNYLRQRIGNYDYLIPSEIKRNLFEQFLPVLYRKKMAGEPLIINISLEVEEQDLENNIITNTKILNATELPTMEAEDLATEDAFTKITLYYHIKQNSIEPYKITAVSVDGRSVRMELFNEVTLPVDYDIIFLLHSEDFAGRVDVDRKSLSINDIDLRSLKRLFSAKVSEILAKELPIIAEKNSELESSLKEKYPHLTGYFTTPALGIMSPDIALNKAQEKFFLDQKAILEADHLSDEQYEKSLEISARILMEYILYRVKTIDKLRSMGVLNSEKEIHSLIIPTRKEFTGTNFHDDLYVNNAWLLDDRYMSYNTILSDRRMEDLYEHLKIETEEESSDDTRPDIAIIFSDDPDGNPEDHKVDVVIVELKKLEAKLAEKENVESQLRQRARKLLKYYPNKIQRIWFYGIVDFTDEYVQSLKEQRYFELFGKGKILYNEIRIDVNGDGSLMIPAGIFIQSYNTFLDDAEHRNDTFLKILKKNIGDKPISQ